MSINVKVILWKWTTLKDGCHPIKIEITLFDKKRRRIATGVSVHPNNWNGVYPFYVAEGDPDRSLKNEQIARKLNELALGGAKTDRVPSFYELLDVIIRERTNEVTPRRIGELRRTKTWMLKFEKQTGYVIDYESINGIFFTEFKSYLIKHKYAQNTLIKFFKSIKQVMNKGVIRGYHNNQAFREGFWRIPEYVPEAIYLSEEQLVQISKVEMSPRLSRVKETLIVGCYLGLRYSDLMRVEHGNLQEFRDKRMVKIHQSKTGSMVVIPIKPIVGDILDKYKGLPPKISMVKFNLYIKEVCKIAGIVKHAEVCSHTMRRSFATNGYLAGIKSIDLMKVTGHKTEKAFLRYIRVSKEETAERLSDHEFFM